MSDKEKRTRYEVTILLGPCTQEQADAFVDFLTDDPETAFALGAVWSLGPAPASEVPHRREARRERARRARESS